MAAVTTKPTLLGSTEPSRTKPSQQFSLHKDSRAWLETRREVGPATALTCVIQAQREERLAGPLGTVSPDLVDKVLLDRNEVVASTP